MLNKVFFFLTSSSCQCDSRHTHHVWRRSQSPASVGTHWTSFWELAPGCYSRSASALAAGCYTLRDARNRPRLHQLPPTLPFFGVSEVSRVVQPLVELPAHLPPHLPLLTQALLQLGGQVVAGLGDGIWLTGRQADVIQHALRARHPLQVQTGVPIRGHVLFI